MENERLRLVITKENCRLIDEFSSMQGVYSSEALEFCVWLGNGRKSYGGIVEFNRENKISKEFRLSPEAISLIRKTAKKENESMSFTVHKMINATFRYLRLKQLYKRG